MEIERQVAVSRPRMTGDLLCGFAARDWSGFA